VVNTRGEPRIEAVADQRLSPTYTRSLARQLARILEAAPCGLYHATNAGGCSWFEFAQEMLARVGIGVDLQPIPSAKLGRPAPRPASCVLANAALRALGLDGMEPWQEALGQYLRDRVATSARPEEI
jgi:dTDP-4-dehydrorhamnose reductase